MDLDPYFGQLLLSVLVEKQRLRYLWKTTSKEFKIILSTQNNFIMTDHVIYKLETFWVNKFFLKLSKNTDPNRKCSNFLKKCILANLNKYNIALSGFYSKLRNWE
jgi:hypothetical protein